MTEGNSRQEQHGGPPSQTGNTVERECAAGASCPLSLLRRNASGTVIETPEQMLERVARAVFAAEMVYRPASSARFWEQRFHEMLASLDFLPNSPTLMNAGLHPGQLSACFVPPIEDTLDSIFRALSNMATIQSYGGGTGFSFSRLCSRGQPLRSTGGMASGPVSFMRVFDSATENIRLGGRRRGANMAVLRVDHPDTLEFIGAYCLSQAAESSGSSACVRPSAAPA